MRPILTLAEPFELTKATKALQKKLNERIAKHNLNVEAFFTEIEKLEIATVDEVAERGFAATAEIMPRERLDLMSEELRIRRDSIEYFEARSRDLQAAIDGAILKHQAVRVDLGDKFLSIGFEKVVLPAWTEPVFPPILFFEHPLHKAALQELSALQAMVNSSPQQEANRVAIERIEGEIDQVRRRMLAKAKS